MILVICFTVILILFIILKKSQRKINDLGKRYQCPSIIPFFGNLYHFLGNKGILASVESWLTISGENILIYLSNKPYIIVNDPNMVEFLLKSKKLLMKPAEYKYLSEIFGSGLLTNKGVAWAGHRKLLIPNFQESPLREFIKIFDSHTKTLIRNLKDEIGNESFDIVEYISLCSLDIICETAMGLRIDAQEDPTSELVSSFYKLPEIVYNKCFTSHRFEWIYYVSSNYQEEKRVTSIIKNFSQYTIKCRKKEILSKGLKLSKKKYSFLDSLVKATIDGHSLSESEIRDELNTLIFAGHTTITSAICFTLYLLSKHQSIQNNVYEELESIYGTKITSPSSLEKLNNMKYLEQVIKESLRLYPPISVYARLVNEDVEFDGIVIPKGVSAVFLPYVLHRDPIIYPEPKNFDPERFAAQNEKRRHPYAYIPFSAGPRNCIGKHFAMLELKILLSKIILHYVILPAIPNHDVEPVIRLTLESANGIKIRLKRRI